MKMIRNVAWIAVLVAGALLAYRLMGAASGPVSDKDSFVQASLPGGPFTLSAHTGAKVSDTDFRGKHMLIYFGYSFCPDVCPLELQKIAMVLKNIEAKGIDTTPVQPIFISVDPERDTVEELARYVPQFHDRMIGLTGTPEEIAVLAKAYKVYYKKLETEDMADYLMDHLNVVFLMGPDGKYSRIFTARDTPEDMQMALEKAIAGAG